MTAGNPASSDPAALLAALRARGVQLAVRGDRLRYRAPEGALSPALRAAMSAAKPALLAQLAAEACSPIPEDLGTLVLWFQGASLPTAPFALTPWRRVIDPARFYETLRADLARGPECLRARSGALQQDLAALRVACAAIAQASASGSTTHPFKASGKEAA